MLVRVVLQECPVVPQALSGPRSWAVAREGNNMAGETGTLAFPVTELKNAFQGFLPQISGLIAWYAADQITPVANGTGIAQWNDLSGNNYHLLKANVTNQPKYYGAAQGPYVMPSGKPLLLFDGSTSFMATNAFTQQHPMTIVMVNSIQAGGIFTPSSFVLFWDSYNGNPECTAFGAFASSGSADLNSCDLRIFAGQQFPGLDGGTGPYLVSCSSVAGGVGGFYNVVAGVYNGARSFGWLNGQTMGAVGTIIFYGTVSGAQSSTSLQDLNQTWNTLGTNNWGIWITSGPGVGQIRGVVSSSGSTLIIDVPWVTTPVSGQSTYA